MSTKIKKKVVKIGNTVKQVVISFRKTQRKGKIKNARKFNVPRDAAQVVVRTPKSAKTKTECKEKSVKTKAAKKKTKKENISRHLRTNGGTTANRPPENQAVTHKKSFYQNIINFLYKNCVLKEIAKPRFKGIFFEKGNIVASNGHI